MMLSRPSTLTSTTSYLSSARLGHAEASKKPPGASRSDYRH